MGFNSQLQANLRNSIAAGLKKRTLTKCSKWSCESVVMGQPFPGPFGFKYHPWLRDMMDANEPEIIGQKAAQMGFTVAAMNRSFFNIDVKRQSVLYLLPTKTPDATDFSANRFDPSLELSPYLSKLFSDVKNVATKRAGSATLYIRGANSRSGLKSIPVANIIFDELDEMPKDNIPLAMERTSGQQESQVWKISTATAPNFGINIEFMGSSQEHFHFPCPGCGRQIELDRKNLIIVGEQLDDPRLIESYIECHECHKVLSKGADALCKAEFLQFGKWVRHGSPTATKRGFYINQLYSPAKAGRPVELAAAWLRSLFDKASEQEFYNSKLGLPHLVEGAQINDANINNCLRSHRMSDPIQPGLITMGVDVGKWLHVEIASWQIKKMGNDVNIMSEPVIIYSGKVPNFEDLDTLMKQYQVIQCVIDANPEGRKATEFARRFHGHVKLCYYGKDKAARTIGKLNENSESRITVDRTSWLDLALGRFMNGTIHLPQDISQEFKDHLKAPARQWKLDRDGNPVGTYINLGADHFAHARCYNEIALPIAASVATNSDIASFL